MSALTHSTKAMPVHWEKWKPCWRPKGSWVNSGEEKWPHWRKRSKPKWGTWRWKTASYESLQSENKFVKDHHIDFFTSKLCSFFIKYDIQLLQSVSLFWDCIFVISQPKWLEFRFQAHFLNDIWTYWISAFYLLYFQSYETFSGNHQKVQRKFLA